MKPVTWLVFPALCLLLLLYSESAVAAAREAVSLWLMRVLPALFPFYVATALLSAGGLFRFLSRRCPRLLLPACLLLGAVSGYPVGARLSAGAGRSEWSAYCNLCSPAFLLGVVAIGMLDDAGFVLPLAISHYGAALIALLAGWLLPQKPRVSKPFQLQAMDSSLTQIIAEGMLAMLRIGGCILFFSVCAALVEAVFRIRNGFVCAVLTSLMEITAGSQAFAVLGISARLKCACIAAFISFGGFSVYMQARSVTEGIRPLPYLSCKAFQGALAFLIAYAITPWFCPEACATLMADADSILENASTMAAFLLSASAGMCFAYLLALSMKKARRHLGEPL